LNERSPLSEPKLLLSKYLFTSANSLLNKAEPYSAGLAISLYQDAVESMAWSVAKAVDAKVAKKSTFEELWHVIELAPGNFEHISLPFKATMAELNQARVSFKHYGIVPNYREAERFSGHVREFLHETANLFFKIDFGKLSLTDLIRSLEIRRLVRESEDALSEGRLDDSLSAIARAESELSRQFQQLIPVVSRDLWGLSELSRLDQKINRSIREISGFLNKLRDSVFQVTAKRDIAAHARFLRIAPRALNVASGEYCYQKGPHHIREPSRDDVEFCIKFVTEYALEAQEQLKYHS
jgi:hypothetical protein